MQRNASNEMKFETLFQAALEKTAITTKMAAETKMRQIKASYEQLKKGAFLQGMETPEAESSFVYQSYLVHAQLEIRYFPGLGETTSYEDGVLYVDVSMSQFSGSDGEKLILADTLARIAFFIGCCHVFSETYQASAVIDRLRASEETIFDHLMCCRDFDELQQVLEKNQTLLIQGLVAGVEEAMRRARDG